MNKMWVNADRVVAAASPTIEVIDPATEEVLEEVPRGTPKDVDRAVVDA